MALAVGKGKFVENPTLVLLAVAFALKSFYFFHMGSLVGDNSAELFLAAVELATVADSNQSFVEFGG